MNTNKSFYHVDEEYRKRYYAKGYFETVAKNGSGVALIILSAILILIGLGPGYLAIRFLQEAISTPANAEPTAIIVLGTIGLVSFVLGFLVMRIGWKRKGMGAEAWIEKYAQASNYTQDKIRDCGQQVVYSDSIRYELLGKGGLPYGVGFLTRDYIFFENLIQPCVISIEDITGAYLVELPDVVSAGTKIKTVHNLNVAVFSSRKTYISSKAKKQNAEELLRLLTERNPDINTADGRVLTSDEYDRMIAEIRQQD